MTELAKVLAEGEAFVKNAEEALARPVISVDQLYVWDNQVEVIDLYLADTEELQDGSGELKDLRGRLRGLKSQLEKQSIEVQAKAEGIDLPEEGSSDEIGAEFEEFAKEMEGLASDALKENVENVTQLERWEAPYSTLSGFLADTEAYASRPKLKAARERIRAKRAELKTRIDDMVRKWREADIAGGGEGAEGEEE